MSFVEVLVAGLSPLKFITDWRHENTIREQHRQQVRLDALKVLIEHGHPSEPTLKGIISFVESGRSQDLAILVVLSPPTRNKEITDCSLREHSLDTATKVPNSLCQGADDE